MTALLSIPREQSRLLAGEKRWGRSYQIWIEVMREGQG